jgi:hypothetical protein
MIPSAEPRFSLVAWMDENNPLPGLERKWITGAALSAEEIDMLHYNRANSLDRRVRDTCGVLLAAIEGQTCADPHVQRLRRERNAAVFRQRLRAG